MVYTIETHCSTVRIDESLDEEPIREASPAQLRLYELSSNSPMVDLVNASPQKKSTVWALPWIVMMVALYAFTLPWISVAIFQRYFLQNNWGEALPGLDSTPYRKFTMRGHMANGAICLLLGPFQFMPRLRRYFPVIHRWSGRVYCICGMLSSLFGLTFIALKQQLVGGWNMTAAFASAGLTLGVLTLKAWQMARVARAGGDGADFTVHRNWGIRSYSQILAPVLYRYWYICLEIFHLYQAPVTPRFGGVCRSDDICPDYLRIFDMLHCWTYWITSLGVAELIIYFLPTHKSVERERAGEASSIPMEVELEAETLLMSIGRSSKDGRTNIMDSLPEDEERVSWPPQSIRSPSPIAVNLIGWLLAGITVGVTTRLFLYPGDD